MAEFDVTIKAVEDVTEDGESMSPPRLVVGSSIDIDVTDGENVTIWGDCVAVNDPTADPEDVARDALIRAGFTGVTIADEWLPGNTAEESGAPVVGTGRASR